LEDYVGREKFDEFLNQYFTSHAFQSNHTEAFVDYLQKNLFVKNGLQPINDLDEWIYGTGLPASLPKVVSQRFLKVEAANEHWRNGDISFDTDVWSSHEWVYFIKKLPENMSAESMAQLDRKFQFTQSGNSEILGVWFVHCARQWYEQSFVAMEQFLVHTGRRKFLMPVYSELIKTERGKAIAKNIYEKARPNYHFVATNSLDKLLGR
jgi:hypothetical protein